LIISKSETYTLRDTDIEKVKYGAYTVLKERKKEDIIKVN